jgi:hypothetical protein
MEIDSIKRMAWRPAKDMTRQKLLNLLQIAGHFLLFVKKALKGKPISLGLLMTFLGFFTIGPGEIFRFLFPPDPTMDAVIKAAEVDSVNFPVPSSEGVIVKVMHGSAFDDEVPQDDRSFLFTQVSPFRPADMGTVFRGGDRCRFLGKGRALSQSKREGYIDVTEISCVDDRGVSFTLSATRGRRLGFVTNVGDASSTGVQTVHDGHLRVLRQFDNVAIRFDKPIMALVEQGGVW